MSKISINLCVFLILAFMLSLSFFSMLDDSAIMDEVAHLPAGYSYISQADMRLNPEHPPLVKDLAGGAVWLWSKIFNQPINFPYDISAWKTDINGQWDFGFDFMYREGNNADLMLLLGRLPMLLILLVLGIYVFKWARELFGLLSAFLALFLYAFSPTFLAHGRFVTTDMAAAAAIFIASYYFIRWLKAPGAKNLIVAGLIFGLAQLAKFSVFLLVPLFVFVALVWFVVKLSEEKNKAHRINLIFWPYFFRYVGGTILLMAVGYIFIVWPVYIFHIWNYPIARQQRDVQFILSSFGFRPLPNFIYWLAGVPIFRALAQYGLGLTMVFQRAVGGNTVYFLGHVSSAGSRLYFPIVYLIKETLTLHIFTLLALWLTLVGFFKNKIYRLKNFLEFLNGHGAEFLMLCFIALYWFSSIRSILNIGVRHILPTFPFVFILIAGVLGVWLKKHGLNHIAPAQENQPLAKKFCPLIVLIIFSILIGWQIKSVISVYPSFLAYFNESAGGPVGGYRYVTDSNLDWGQDLKRLAQWTDEKNINRIYVDYFGGATSSYYLGNKFLPWWGDRSPMDLNFNGGWLAVSATFLQGGRGEPVPGFKETVGYYKWLNKFQPTTVIGHSIFVYYIPPHAF